MTTSPYPPSWYAASVEPLPPQPALQGDIDADVCILGAGYVGLSAALELAECYVFIHDEGIPDEVYDRVGGILSEEEYVALSWLLVSINAFNRITIAGKYPVPPRHPAASASTASVE